MLSEEQKKLIEKFGVVLERSGLAPAQARVSGLLIISDEVEMTFDEIMDALQLSKSATSNAINSLLMMDKIAYKTRPGERKRYFRSKIGTMEGDLERKFNQVLDIQVLLQEILDQRTTETVEFNMKLAKVVEFLKFMQAEMPAVYEKWKKTQLD